MELSLAPEMPGLTRALQVKHSAAPQNKNSEASQPSGKLGFMASAQSDPTWCPPPQGWVCLTALGVETSQTFAQVSPHVSLSMYINQRRG